jgi:hypothetical protein
MALPHGKHIGRAMNPGMPRPPYLDPAVFPTHESEIIDPVTKLERPDSDMERLLTYCKNPETYECEQVSSGSMGWGPASPGSFSWAISKTTTTNNGFYVDMKLGYKGAVAGGIEGSFKFQIKFRFTRIALEFVRWDSR